MSESYERLEQQFNEIVAKQARPVAEVIAGGHGPLHGVVRWLSGPISPGALLCEAPPRWCDFVSEERRKVLAAHGVAPSQAPSRELPELPEAVAHVHSNGEVCMNRPVESNGVWPVELVTLKQAHDYARAYAAPVKGMEATSPMPKCMCGQPWVLNTVHRANSPCWLAQEPPGGLGPNPDGFAAALPSPDQPKADAGVALPQATGEKR